MERAVEFPRPAPSSLPIASSRSLTSIVAATRATARRDAFSSSQLARPLVLQKTLHRRGRNLNILARRITRSRKHWTSCGMLRGAPANRKIVQSPRSAGNKDPCEMFRPVRRCRRCRRGDTRTSTGTLSLLHRPDFLSCSTHSSLACISAATRRFRQETRVPAVRHVKQPRLRLQSASERPLLVPENSLSISVGATSPIHGDKRHLQPAARDNASRRATSSFPMPLFAVTSTGVRVSLSRDPIPHHILNFRGISRHSVQLIS